MNSSYSSTEKIIDLASRIVAGRTTQNGVKKELESIEKEYENPFIPYSVEYKEKPWDIEYLKKLRKAVPFGAMSKEYLLYMSEVADNVYKLKLIIKNVLIGIAATSAVIIVLLSIKTFLSR